MICALFPPPQVRLGFHWHLYETSPGNWNETYIEVVQDVATRLGDAGIYVLMDMHQDNWSPLYCGGHGFPAFIGFPKDDPKYYRGGAAAFPWPVASPTYSASPLCVPSPSNASHSFCAIADCSNATSSPLGWASTYATAALGSSAQRLYDDDGGVLGLFEAFWARVARRFAPLTNVVGYGLVNEPWLGDVWADPTLLLPGQSDLRNLQPMYARLAAAIRAADPDTPVWFEPATGGNILDALPAGFNATPDANSALGYHVYCPSLQVDLPHSGHRNETKLWEDLAGCQAMNAAQFDVRDADRDRLGVPGVLTEFGSVSQMPQTEALLRWTVAEMDRRLNGWAYWLLNPSTDPARPNWELPVLRRPFPHSVPGRLVSLDWDTNTTTLRVVFGYRPPAGDSSALRGAGQAAPAASVYAPPEVFGGSAPSWTVSPPESVSSGTQDPATGVLTLLLEPTLAAGTNVTITLQG